MIQDPNLQAHELIVFRTDRSPKPSRRGGLLFGATAIESAQPRGSEADEIQGR